MRQLAIKCKQTQIFALVDDDEFELVRRYEWLAKFEDGLLKNVYRVFEVDGHLKNVLLHRFIMRERNPEVIIDHIDGNPLNCQKTNLRKCDKTESNRNRSAHRGSKSPYKGVVWDAPKKMWRAQISLEGKRKFLGYFEKEEDAAHNYDYHANRVHGNFARLNFPSFDYNGFQPKRKL